MDAIVLIGMPGSGKSRVGVALAQLLNWGFVDTDEMISAAVGCDFAEYIRTEGIEAARVAETDVVSTLPARLRANTVVAVGGGTVLHPGNRAVLSGLGPVVWLRALPATLLTRVTADPRDRPLLEGGAGALAQLLDERTPIYQTCASVVVDVDGLDPNEVAVSIVRALAA